MHKDTASRPEDDMAGTAQNTDAYWLSVAREAFRVGTEFMETSLRKQREINYSLFRNRHVPGSKYYTDSYKYRSKIFRPKVRSAIRRHEAAAAVAYFSTQDVASVMAEDDNNEDQRIGAELQQELLNYRLEQTIPWFLTLIGAYQESMVVGAVCSKQYWQYVEREETKYVPVHDEVGNTVTDEDGNTLYEEVKEMIRVKDKPVVELIPPENYRYDPAASWVDPVGTSPYFIHLIPMYVGDIKTRMREVDPKTGQPKWRQLSDQQLQSSSQQQYDSTRQAREGRKRQDSKESRSDIQDFNVLWVHENFITHEGQELVYYTLGTDFMLSDPVPIEEVYLTGRRPFVIGYSQVEAHRIEPAGIPEIAQGLQQEANDIANQRLDNIKLALNKRYFVRRGAKVDFRSLTRNVPGGITLVDDLNSDVKAHETNDVTSSSYQEQDRLSLDLDEVVGGFSPGSVQSNRKLNETVGGMELLANDSNVMAEYQLRVFTETWTERVLEQLLLLERAYETDETVLAVAGQRAKLWSKYKLDTVTEDLLTAPATVKIAVGFGATSPQKRIEKLALGLNTVATFFPTALQRLNGPEIIKEVFGALGYKSGARFFEGLDDGTLPSPELEQANATIQQLQQALSEVQGKLQGKEVEAQSRIQAEQIRGQTALRIEQAKLLGKRDEIAAQAQLQIELQKMRQQISYINSQIAAEKNQIAVGELELEKQALVYQMKAKELEALKAVTGDKSMSGVLMRDRYGMAPGAEG